MRPVSVIIAIGCVGLAMIAAPGPVHANCPATFAAAVAGVDPAPGQESALQKLGQIKVADFIAAHDGKAGAMASLRGRIGRAMAAPPGPARAALVGVYERMLVTIAGCPDFPLEAPLAPPAEVPAEIAETLPENVVRVLESTAGLATPAGRPVTIKVSFATAAGRESQVFEYRPLGGGYWRQSTTSGVGKNPKTTWTYGAAGGAVVLAGEDFRAARLAIPETSWSRGHVGRRLEWEIEVAKTNGKGEKRVTLSRTCELGEELPRAFYPPGWTERIRLVKCSGAEPGYFYYLVDFAVVFAGIRWAAPPTPDRVADVEFEIVPGPRR